MNDCDFTTYLIAQIVLGNDVKEYDKLEFAKTVCRIYRRYNGLPEIVEEKEIENPEELLGCCSR